jgi:glycerol-1-phosphate dehydrogenase [NAD(P)+]
VHPDIETVARVRAATAHADGLVAVGSGTINDLVKFSAAQDGKPFAVFATAPSMNGYTSANAAITVDGHKKTLPAALTRGVFMDLEILAAAPPRMIRAGLGDSLCRPTAQVDWLLSHHLLGTKYRAAPFALLAADEALLFEQPEALLAGDLDAMRALARTLVLSGIGMTLCGGSYPASQGEHLISHYIDMRSPPARADYLHGEQVAVSTRRRRCCSRPRSSCPRCSVTSAMRSAPSAGTTSRRSGSTRRAPRRSPSACATNGAACRRRRARRTFPHRVSPT